MPCAMVRKNPGTNKVSGVTLPLRSRLDCVATAASESSEPASTMVSLATRLPMRLVMKLPERNPNGNSRK